MSRGWLIVFAKAPRPGLVKTRLSPPLSFDQCADLYAAMLVDVLEASARFAADLDLLPVLAFHPPDAADELIGHAPPGYRLQAQHGADLAARMANAFAEAAAAGVDRVLLRGSDSPTLDAALCAEALTRLDAGDDLVMTPDQGGGYSAIGMRAPRPALFDVTMSTQHMLSETMEIAQSLALRSSITAPALDLDTIEDLRRFEAQRPAPTLDLCPRTVESISSLDLATVL